VLADIILTLGHSCYNPRAQDILAEVIMGNLQIQNSDTRITDWEPTIQHRTRFQVKIVLDKHS